MKLKIIMIIIITWLLKSGISRLHMLIANKGLSVRTRRHVKSQGPIDQKVNSPHSAWPCCWPQWHRLCEHLLGWRKKTGYLNLPPHLEPPTERSKSSDLTHIMESVV